MQKRRKYPFATMEVGEVVTIETRWPSKVFQHYVYTRAMILNRRFSTLQVSPGTFHVRRTDGLPDSDTLARSRSRSATLMHARLRAQRQEARRLRLRGGRMPLLDQYRGSAVPWSGAGGRFGLDAINKVMGKGIGVYLLWRGPMLLYVGSSHVLWERLSGHRTVRKAPKRIPTAVTILLCKTIQDARRLESELIDALDPFENVQRSH